MSSILLTVSGVSGYYHNYPNRNNKQPKKQDDKKTCVGCIYQGKGSDKCKNCKRSCRWDYYTAPRGLQDNYKQRR